MYTLKVVCIKSRLASRKHKQFLFITIIILIAIFVQTLEHCPLDHQQLTLLYFMIFIIIKLLTSCKLLLLHDCH